MAVQEVDLATKRRLGDAEQNLFVVMSNLAVTYQMLGRDEETLRLKRDVYSGRLKLNGEEDIKTHRTAYNYANSLLTLKRFEEAKALLRKTIPVVRRVLGDNDGLTLRVRGVYAQALYFDAEATLDDLREAVTTLGEIERTARRVLGGAHPLTGNICGSLRTARTVLHARETPSSYHEGKSFEELRLEYLIRTN